MRINWFSPIEPRRTGIAQYSNMIVPWLAQQAEVAVWTTQPDWDQTLGKAEVNLYRVEEMPWRDLNRAELTFFHMGNNVEFHLDVWQASRQYPGIVVLHDAFYPDFFNGVRERQRDGRLSGDLRAPEPGAGKYAPLASLLDKATAALVHSPAEFDGLAQALPCPVLLTNLPYQAASDAKFAAWKKLRQPGRTRARLVTFGYLNANRRVESILEVLAQFRSQFELHLIGELSDPRPIEAKIDALGLRDSVHVYGYVEDLDDALAQADLAINLRNPTMGEASGSQLRIWDHALPSIVTRIAWYAHLPEDAVRFVRPEAELEDLAGHLRAFLQDREGFARIGENGRRVLLANHSPEEYARDLVSLGDKAAQFQCAAAAQFLGARVGEDLRKWFDPECHGFTERVAREIGEIFG
jgi:glycosyltransferase involved in cell wall biosynthesis